MSKQLESILQRVPKAMIEPTSAVQAKSETAPQLAGVNVGPQQRPPSAPAAIATQPREKDVSLGIEVPASVKRAVNIHAATEGVTNRTILLRALQAIGLDVPREEIRDRRK